MKLFLLLTMLIPCTIFAGEIYFKVIETTPAWGDINFPTLNNISTEIQAGSIVRGHRGVQPSRLGSLSDFIILQQIFYNNRQMLIYANSIIPLSTSDLFAQHLLYNPERTLLTSVYLKSLAYNNLELIYLHNKDAFDSSLENWDYHMGEVRWMTFAIPSNCLIITQTALTFRSGVKGNSHLLIRGIEKTGAGYVVTVRKSFISGTENRWWNWPVPPENGSRLFRRIQAAISSRAAR